MKCMDDGAVCGDDLQGNDRRCHGESARRFVMSWSEFETGDVTLALHPASAENPAGGVQLGFAVDDVTKLYEARADNGLDFTSPPRPQSGSILARIRTSEGAEISLSS